MKGIRVFLLTLYSVCTQSLGNKRTKKMAAILGYLTKGCNQNSFVMEDQYRGCSVPCKRSKGCFQESYEISNDILSCKYHGEGSL